MDKLSTLVIQLLIHYRDVVDQNNVPRLIVTFTLCVTVCLDKGFEFEQRHSFNYNQNLANLLKKK